MIQGAEALWKALRGKITALVRNETSNCLRVARYEVVSTASGGKMGVKLPYGNTTLLLPYSAQVASAAVGDIVLVMWYGTLSTAKIVSFGDGFA